MAEANISNHEFKKSWLNDYTLVEFLGCGSYGGVYKSEHKITKELCAVKITYVQKHLQDLDDDDMEVEEACCKMRREFFLPSGKTHKNIVNVYDGLETQIKESEVENMLKSVGNPRRRDAKLVKSDLVYWAGESGLHALLIRMEICGMTLRQWIDGCEEQGPDLWVMQRPIVQGILDGLEFLHQNKILHRDLKSENIFFATGSTNCHVKIGDFGIGRIIHTDESRTSAQTMKPETTPLYRAPELETEEDYTFQADLYSLGLIILEIIKMLKANERRVEFTRIRTREFDLDLPIVPFENGREVVLKLTEVETTKRMQTVRDVQLTLMQTLRIVLEKKEYSPEEFFEIVTNYVSIISDLDGGTIVAGEFDLSCDNRIIENVVFRSRLTVKGNNNQLYNITGQEEAFHWCSLNILGNGNILLDTKIDCPKWDVWIDGNINAIANVVSIQNNASIRIRVWSGYGHIIKNIMIPKFNVEFSKDTSFGWLQNVKCGFESTFDGRKHSFTNVECDRSQICGDGHNFINCGDSAQ